MDSGGRGNGIAMVIAFLMGALTGGLISLLCAPASGKETREKIRNASVDAKNRTFGAAHRASERAKGTVHELVDHSKSQIDSATDSVKAAVETGKKTFSEKKAELADAISHVSASNDASNENSADSSDEKAAS